MITATPYRTEALAIVREVSICSWCVHSRSSRHDGMRCKIRTTYVTDFVTGDRVAHYIGYESNKVRDGRAPCEHYNDRGQCEKFEPSTFTRVLRFLHIGRAPETREA